MMMLVTRKRYPVFFCLNIFILMCVGSIARAQTYTNPLKNFSIYGNVSDPGVLKYNGVYYLYATGSISHSYGFNAWTSTDLVNWVHQGVVFKNSDSGNEWGKSDFWAPEVINYHGFFYLIYSARASDGKLKIALARASHPLGPFINVAAPLLDEKLTCIDGHLFIDDDGAVYLFYAKDCSDNIVSGYHTSQIFGQRLVANYFQPEGEPWLAVQPEQAWELRSGDWRWNEGPYVVKHDSLYYLMYSANYFASADYAIGCATAASPRGPWIKYANNPLLEKNLAIGVSGPGHHSVTTSPDDSEWFVVYHTHIDAKNPDAGRQLNIDRMYFDNEGVLKIIGPTRSPQPYPSSAGTSAFSKINFELPRQLALAAIYPNPFNSLTAIEYSVGTAGGQFDRAEFISMKIFNLLGRELAVLVNENKTPGNYRVWWDGRDGSGLAVSTGNYICQIKSNRSHQAKLLTIVK